MKIIRAAGVQFEAVRGFYHSMIRAGIPEERNRQRGTVSRA